MHSGENIYGIHSLDQAVYGCTDSELFNRPCGDNRERPGALTRERTIHGAPVLSPSHSRKTVTLYAIGRTAERRWDQTNSTIEWSVFQPLNRFDITLERRLP